MIYDAVHQAVLLYQEHKAQLLELAAPLELPPPSAREQEFHALWKQFYDTLEIKARHNEKGPDDPLSQAFLAGYGRNAVILYKKVASAPLRSAKGMVY